MNEMTKSGIIDALKPVLKPEHVAVIGASRTAGKAGNLAIRNLLLHRFPGRISLINPSADEIEGIKCFPSIAKAPGGIDCALIVIPAADVVETARECAKAGVKSIVIGASGFAELGTDIGRRLQVEILEAAQTTGMRVLGPNTNGVFNNTDHVSLGTNRSHGELIDTGPISVVAHSGALFNHFARKLKLHGAGLSKYIPVGNEADLTMLDFLEYFVEDDATRVIGMIIEGISEGQRFRELAEEAHNQGKSIIALKLGRSKSGAGAALAHSTRLAGNAKAYDALFETCRVACVPTVEALAGGCALLAQRTATTLEGDQRMVCVSSSGAGAAMLADLAETRSIPLAVDAQGCWEEPAASMIAAIKTKGRVNNPIDTGSLGSHDRLSDVFAALLKSGVTGPTIMFTHTFDRPNSVEGFLRVLSERKASTSAPIAIASPAGLPDHIVTGYLEHGIPVFADTATCMDAIRCHYATLPSAAADTKLRALLERTGDTGAARDLLQRAIAKSAYRRFLTEVESAEVLRAVGVPMVESRAIGSADEAGKAAAALGYPVVLKALAPDVTHKNQHGFVITGIADAEVLQRSYDDLLQRVVESGYESDDVPVIVQPMLTAKTELIVGVNLEKGLGHFLVVGLGGIYTEALNEVALLTVPTAVPQINVRLRATRIGRLLAAMDDGKNTLFDQVVETLDGLQRLAVGCGDLVESVDVNPLLVTDAGCTAVDALVVLRPSA